MAYSKVALRKTKHSMSDFNFSFLKSPSFWSNVVLVLSAAFTALSTQYPSDTWIGSAVGVLSFISANYFHKQEVKMAAQSSLTLGKVVSGQ